MPLSHFRQPPKILAHVRNAALPGPYPQRLEALFPLALTDRAVAQIKAWPGHEPTPSRSLHRPAGAPGLGAVPSNDETGRFGLGSFPALGGSLAVLPLPSAKLGLSMAAIALFIGVVIIYVL